MNLREISPMPNAKKLNRFYESRFGFTIDFNRLTMPKAKRIYRQLEENLVKIKSAHGIYFSEQNPKYVELLSVKEGLSLWIKNNNVLTESETARAEVKTAAMSMVDEIQSMIAKISKMQNEELIALVSAARDQIGIDQASAFNQSANASIATILETLKAQADALDLATRQLAGDEGVPMSAPGGMPAEVPAEVPAEEPTLQATGAAAGGTEPLGRERR